MNAAKLYGDYVWRTAQKGNKKRAGKLINTGLDLYGWFIARFGDRRMPQAYRDLMSGGLRMVADALSHPEKLAYTNIFAPVEILECFGLVSASMECLSSYLSGFFIEDRLLDSADASGLASTLCSYHRNFLGAVDEGILPRPRFAVTTSTICDGNINSFRHLRDRYEVPTYIIDIPHEYSPDAEEYVVLQLEEMIAQLEEITGTKLDYEELRGRLRSENRAKEHYLSFVHKRMHHTYPQTLTLVLFQLFASHLDIGTEWAERVFAMMDEEVEKYPDTDEKKLMWLHIEPYAQPTLQSYFNYGDKVSILCGDFDLDYVEPLDAEHPLNAIAKKTICNMYNGDYTRKTEAVARYVEELRPDGVVQFCSWGCRQSAGGVELMKEKMRGLGVPMLILDGDALDRRNCPDGQIRTRFEAFMELLDEGESSKDSRGTGESLRGKEDRAGSSGVPREHGKSIPDSDNIPAAISGADIPGADAPGTDISGADIPGADAPETDISGADIPGADAPGTDMSGADIPGADAPETDIPGTDISEKKREVTQA